jgi:DNA-binding NtrC family response regulator
MTLKEIEKNAILSALQQCHWRRREAAKILGVTTRTIENKIARYREEGMEIPLWRQRRNVSRETESSSV